MPDRAELFDVLDADSSGYIDFAELIGGLMKMRTTSAEKSDVVATILAMRSSLISLKSLGDAIGELREEVKVFNDRIYAPRPSSRVSRKLGVDSPSSPSSRVSKKLG